MKYILFFLVLINIYSCSNWQATAVDNIEYGRDMSTDNFIQKLRAEYLSKSSIDIMDFMERDTLNDQLILSKIDLSNFYISFIDYENKLISVYYRDENFDLSNLTYFSEATFDRYNSHRPIYLQMKNPIENDDYNYLSLLGITCENKYGDFCEESTVGIIPNQRLAFYELVKNKDMQLLCNALKGFSPSGRLYAAEGLLLLKENGNGISKDCLTTIDSLKINDKDKIWKCFSGSGSYKGEYTNFSSELTKARINELLQLYKWIDNFYNQ